MELAPVRTGRRTFLMSLAASAGTSACALPRTADTQSPSGTLHAFLEAFERCDLPLMESFFAPDATHFDRFPPGAQDATAYMRGHGMPPGMRDICSKMISSGGKPPYHRVDPKDLLIEIFSETALCTFHLTGDHSLGRRTVLLNKRGLEWKIVHIHASNLPLA